MEQTFEATIEKREKWYIGWVDAVPGAFSHGKTIKEVEDNLKEAVRLILEEREDAELIPIIEAARKEWKQKGGRPWDERRSETTYR